MEDDLGSQAGDLLRLLSVDVGQDSVLSGRDLRWQLNVLCQGSLSLLDGALEADVAGLFAQIGSLLDESDQAVLDLQLDVSACLDIL